MSVRRPARGLPHGFPGERLHVCPRDMCRQVAEMPAAAACRVTDAGYFPAARRHYRERPEGCPEGILILCSNGAGWCRIGNNLFQIRAGEFLLIPPDTSHAYGADAHRPWTIRWAHFEGSIVPPLFHQLPANVFHGPVAPRLAQRLEHDMDELFDVLHGGMTYRRLVYAGALMHRILASLVFANPAFPARPEAGRHRAVDHALRRMRENTGVPLDAARLAREAGVSIPHFYRLFRQETGHAPIETFNRLKIQDACGQLLTTDRSVKEIAGSLGYSSPYYFSRAFRKIMGCPPSAYRCQHLGAAGP